MTGLRAPGLVLRLNNGSDLSVATNRSFKFPGSLTAGNAFAVTVARQPAGQRCTVQSGSGLIAGDVTAVAVACTVPTHPASQLNISGTVNGLKGGGLVLSLGSEQITVPSGATSFAFATPWNRGPSVSVSVVSQPAAQTCVPVSSSFSSDATNATTAYVECRDQAPLPGSTGLAVERSSVVFEAEEGEYPANQTVRGTVSGATPATVTVQVTGNGLSGGYYQSVSAQAGVLTLQAKPSDSLAPGVYRDTVTVKACEDAGCARQIAGSPQIVDVTYTVKPRQTRRVLMPDVRAVAFSATPSGNRMTRTVVIRENAGTALTWQAASDAAWLQVTPSGASDGAVTLVANAGGLADGFHEAVVTLTTTTAGVRPSAIRVGLYKSGSASAATMAAPLVNVDDFTSPGLRVVDPVRPLIYSAVGNTIAAHHVYGGQRTGALTLGFVVSQLAVSTDGRRLYALDRDGSGIAVIDAATLTLVRQNALPINGQLRSRMVALHVGGENVLVVSDGEMPFGQTIRTSGLILRAETGQFLGEVGGLWLLGSAMLAVSGNGQVMVGGTGGTSGYLAAHRYVFRSNSVGMIYGVVAGASPEVNTGNLLDIAANHDGSQVLVNYGAAPVPWPYRFNGTSLVLEPIAPFASNANSHQGDVEFDIAGRLYLNDRVAEVRLYRADGSLQIQAFNQSWAGVWGGPAGTLRISSDGVRMIGNGQLVDAP